MQMKLIDLFYFAITIITIALFYWFIIFVYIVFFVITALIFDEVLHYHLSDVLAFSLLLITFIIYLGLIKFILIKMNMKFFELTGFIYSTMKRKLGFKFADEIK